MIKLDNNSIIRRKLKSKSSVKFTCGIKDVDGSDKVFNTHISEINYKDRTEYSYSINEDRFLGRGMNVNKFGPTCVSLYTFDMFGRKIVGKIRYADVRFVDMEQFECENPLKKLPGFIGTENCPV